MTIYCYGSARKYTTVYTAAWCNTQKTVFINLCYNHPDLVYMGV